MFVSMTEDTDDAHTGCSICRIVDSGSKTDMVKVGGEEVDRMGGYRHGRR